MAQIYVPFPQTRTKPTIQQNHYNYYDNHQADVPSTDVTANSPSLPTAPQSCYNSYAPTTKTEDAYSTEVHYGYGYPTSHPPNGDHMSAYVPNMASHFPHPDNVPQSAPSYGAIAPGQSWARPVDTQMQYPPVAVGEHTYVDGIHAGQNATHFGTSQPIESDVKAEPTTYEADLSVGHPPSFPQPSHDVPAAYNNQNYGYGQGYEAAPQHQQQVQYQATSGYTDMSGAPHEPQQPFYPPSYQGYAYDQQAYQQQSQQPMPSNDYTSPQPTYGVYSPRRRQEHQQLAHAAPYETYEEPLTKDVDGGELMLNTPPEFVSPAPQGRSATTPEQTGAHGTSDVATSATEAGYGHQVSLSPQASHGDERIQAGAKTGHRQAYGGSLVHRRPVRRHAARSHADAQSPRHAQPAPTTSTLMYPDGTTAPTPEDDAEPPMSLEEYEQKRRTVSYQRHLQERQTKRQRSAQFEEFEANNRPRLNSYQLDADYTYSVAQNNIPHHHHPAHHHRQSSSSSCQSDQSSRMPVPVPVAVPPVVPSQAYERPMPIPLPPSLEPEKKDPPPKKPALACLFCRKRKIACGPPPPDRQDKTCNQCVRRKQVCEYPTESRRGIRKTPKDNAIEEPTVHKFVHGDASSHDGSASGRGKPRRKRSLE